MESRHPHPCHLSESTQQNRPPWGVGCTSAPQQLRQYCLPGFVHFNLKCSGISVGWGPLALRPWNASTLAAVHKLGDRQQRSSRLAVCPSPWPPIAFTRSLPCHLWLQRTVFQCLSKARMRSDRRNGGERGKGRPTAAQSHHPSSSSTD
jgi:hypothetical protein